MNGGALPAAVELSSRPMVHSTTRGVSHTPQPRASAESSRHERAISKIAPETTALRAVHYYPPRFACRGSTAVPRAPDVSRVLLVGPVNRPGSPRATSSLVGDVERPRCSDALGVLAASRLARSPMPTPASGLCHRTCGAKFCAKPSGSSHAQPLTVMPTLIPRATKTPARHTCCWERRAASAPVPHAVSLSRPRFTCPLPPSPAAPHEPCRTSSARLMQDPRRSRAFSAAHAPRQRLTQACAPGQPRSGFRGVEHPASQAGKLDSSGSSAASLRSQPQARRAFQHASGVTKQVWPRNAGATFHRASKAPLPPARGKEARRNSVRVSADQLINLFPPTSHKTPAECRPCRPRNSESAVRIPPPRGGQMPPRRPCRPDRHAFGPASRSACSPRRHVAAFRTDSPAPHP